MQGEGPTNVMQDDDQPPPPPDNPPPIPGLFGPKLSPETQDIIEELKKDVTKLMIAIRDSDPMKSAKAKEEYNHLRQKYYKPYTEFNKNQFNPISQQIDKLKDKIKEDADTLKSQAEIQKKKIEKIDVQINILNKQSSQYADNGMLRSNVERLIVQAKLDYEKEIDVLKKMEIKGTTKALSYEKEMKELMEKKKQLLEKKQEFEAILKAIPELKKETKKEIAIEETDAFPLTYAEISDQLQGVWLYYLKEFLGPRDEEIDVTAYFGRLTNPEIRKPPNVLLPVKVVLGIASGYIVRSSNVTYNDLDPLKGTEINPDQKEFFEILLQDCYKNNPSFKGIVDKPKAKATTSDTLAIFTGILMNDLSKQVKHQKKESKVEITIPSQGFPSESNESSMSSVKLKSVTVIPEKSSKEEQEQSPIMHPPRTKTFKDLDNEAQEREQRARTSDKESGYSFSIKGKEKVSSTQESSATTTETRSKSNRNQSNPRAMMNEVMLTSKHLQLISQLAEDFDGEMPEELPLSEYNETLEKRLQFITDHIVSERKMLQEERNRFAKSEQALEKLRALTEEIDPTSKENSQQLLPHEQIEKATAVMTELKQEVGELQEQIEEAITPVEILQKEKLAGFGHAYSHYKTTHHGQVPSMKEMNEWGDASGLRKHASWKTTVSKAAKLSDEYDENEQKNQLRKKK